MMTLKKCTALITAMTLLLSASAGCVTSPFAQTAEASTVQGPDIPHGEDISDYDPEVNGYYAAMPVSVHESGDETAKTVYPTVLVWDNEVYTALDVLADLTGMVIDIKGDEIALSRNSTRRLLMKISSTMALYTEGYNNPSFSPMTKTAAELNHAPFKLGEDYYVPLDSVLRMFGYSTCVTDGVYQILDPHRDAIDVLAELYESRKTDDKSVQKYATTVVTTRGQLTEAALVDRFNGIVSLDGRHIQSMFKDSLMFWIPDDWSLIDSAQEDQDQIYASKIGKDLLQMDTDTNASLKEQLRSQSMDTISMTKELIMEAERLGHPAMAFAEDSDSLIKGLYGSLKSIGDADASTKLLKRYSKALQVADAVDYAETALGEAILLYNSAVAYSSADQLAVRGLTSFLNSTLADERKSSDAVIGQLKTEKEHFSENTGLGQFLSTLDDTKSDTVVQVAGLFMDSAVGIVSVGYRSIKDYLNSRDQDAAFLGILDQPLGLFDTDRVEAFLKAYYNQFIVHDIGLVLGKRLSDFGKSSGDPTWLRTTMSLAYTYSRACLLQANYYEQSGNFSDDKDRIASIKNASEQAAVTLALSYTEDNDLLPSLAADRARSVSESSMEPLRPILKPLYITISGEVLEKGTDKPISDAQVVVGYSSGSREVAGTFEGTPEGRYSGVNVPMVGPDDAFKIYDSEPSFHLKFGFTSPTVKGRDNKELTWRCTDNTEVALPTAYLGQKFEDIVPEIRTWRPHLERNYVDGRFFCVDWEAVEEAEGYEFEDCSVGEDYYSIGQTDLSYTKDCGNETLFSVGSSIPYAFYKGRVRAYKTENGERIYTQWSEYAIRDLSGGEWYTATE